MGVRPIPQWKSYVIFIIKFQGKAYIAGACVAGYGEAIIKEALKLDLGEIETMAHYKGGGIF